MYVDMYRNSFPYDNRRVMDCGLDDIETQMEGEKTGRRKPKGKQSKALYMRVCVHPYKVRTLQKS